MSEIIYSTNDKMSIDVFYENNYELFVIYGLSIDKDIEIVKDAIQNAFIQYLEKKPLFSNEFKAKAYFFRAIKNYLINIYRRAGVHDKYLKLDNKNHNLNIEEQIIKSEVEQAAISLIDSLPPMAREVFIKSIMGYKASDIAKDMNITIDAVKSQKKKAKKIISESKNLIYFLNILTLF